MKNVNKYAIDLLDEDLGFWVTWLSQKETNLPMAVWVTIKQIAKRVPILLVSNNHLFRGNIRKAISVSIRDNPKIKAGGDLKASDFELVKKFIILNKEVLLDHWRFKIDSCDLVKRLKPIEKP